MARWSEIPSGLLVPGQWKTEKKVWKKCLERDSSLGFCWRVLFLWVLVELWWRPSLWSVVFSQQAMFFGDDHLNSSCCELHISCWFDSDGHIQELRISGEWKRICSYTKIGREEKLIVGLSGLLNLASCPIFVDIQKIDWAFNVTFGQRTIFYDNSGNCMCILRYASVYIWYITQHNTTRHDTTGQDRTGQDRTGHDMTWHDMTFNMIYHNSFFIM